MILAAVDDVFFGSKISAAARQAGVAVTFARTAEDALARLQSDRPTLVIIDLDSRRIRPLELIAAVKQDSTLGSTRAVGFVSHVHGDVIAAARAAGADEILARSAFSAKLADLLASA
jgi:PleD family two-component response regulator